MDRRCISQVLASRPHSQRAAAIIRHAQRHPLGSTTEPSLALLTVSYDTTTRTSPLPWEKFCLRT